MQYMRFYWILDFKKGCKDILFGDNQRNANMNWIFDVMDLLLVVLDVLIVLQICRRYEENTQ